MDPARALLEAPADDATLVERARRGDERAHAQLYHRHAAHVARIAHQLLRNDAEVDDVVQESFVEAAHGLGALREPQYFRRWITTIAVRRVQRLLARRRRRRWLGRELSHVAARASDPRDQARVTELTAALDTLSDKLRIPWVLTRIEGCTLPEAAEACDVSLATLKRRVADADALLTRRLGHE